MTPIKYNQEYSINEMAQSPVLCSTPLSNMQLKSLTSPTPASNGGIPCTPKPKKSVRNILDQLCSPISTKGNEDLECQLSINECDEIPTPFDSSDENKKIMHKCVSDDSNSLNINYSFDKTSQENAALNATHNHLFDDISETSLQLLCEATNQAVSSFIPNVNNMKMRHNSDLIKNKLSHSDKEIKPQANSPVKIPFDCNEKNPGSINPIVLENNKLIYSNKNLGLDVPCSIHLNDIFLEVKCLEEANRTFKKRLGVKESQAISKVIPDQPTSSLNLSSRKDTLQDNQQIINKKDSLQSRITNTEPTKSEIKSEDKILNDSLGISDTQFCEAAEVAELMSNIDATCDSNAETRNTISFISDSDVNHSSSNINNIRESGKEVFECLSPLYDVKNAFKVLPQVPQKSLNNKLVTTELLPGSEPDNILEGFKIPNSKCEKSKKLLIGPNSNLRVFKVDTVNSIENPEKLSKQANQLFDECLLVKAEGFQTASGKIVRISEESLKKVKQLFNDETNFSQTGSQENTDMDVEVFKKSFRQSEKLFVNENLMPNGFQTASGKLVPVSKESLKKAKHLLDDEVDLRDSGSRKKSTVPVTVLKNSVRKSKQSFNDDTNIKCKGFQTAGGKSVQISDESLKKARHLFSDEIYPNLIGYETDGKTSVAVLEKSGESEYSFPVDKNLMFKGFQTASGKSVKISDESLKKARHLFDDEIYVNKSGYQTDSKMMVTVSEKPLKEFEQSLNVNINSLPKGFQTASGKSVKISVDSLKKAKKLLSKEVNLNLTGSQCDSDEEIKVTEKSWKQHGQSSSGNQISFQTAIGKSVKICKDSLEKAKELFNNQTDLNLTDYQSDSYKEVIVCSNANLFSTASGKSVKVSEKSVIKANHTLDELNLTGPRTDSGIPDTTCEKLLKTPKQLKFVNTNVMPNGFQTASGKSVNISKESLEKAKQLFVDAPDIKHNIPQSVCNQSIECSPHDTAQTLVNNNCEPDILLEGYQEDPKSYGISKRSLNSYNAKRVPSSLLEGFQTASGKSVKISEESLKIVKNLLDDSILKSEFSKVSPVSKFIDRNSSKISEYLPVNEEITENNMTDDLVLKGFRMEDKKFDNLLENKTKKIVIEDFLNSKTKPNAFQTASGKGVHISTESLKKAKDLFKDDLNDNEVSLTSFCSSANNKYDECLNSKIRATVSGIDSNSTALESNLRRNQTKIIENYYSDCHDTSKLNKFPPGNNKSVNHESVKRKLSNSVQLDNSNHSLMFNDQTSLKNVEGSFKKRRKLFVENETNNQRNQSLFFCDEDKDISNIGASVISEADLSLLNQSKSALSGNENLLQEHCSYTMSPSTAREISESTAALLADEESNSPFSLKPFITSPGMIQDRQIGLPSIDCFENEIHVNNRPLSPILGSHSLVKKVEGSVSGIKTPVTFLSNADNINTKSSIFKPPYATSTPKDTQLQSKRKLLYSTLHYQAEKRQKTDIESENITLFDVQKARLEAALKQEQYVKEKLKSHKKIKPCKGSYFLRKQTEKSRSLREVSANEPLHIYTLQQLKRYGVKESVQEITIHNVSAFKFSAPDYFSKETASSNINGIPVGDGALLILDGDGKAGTHEVTRAFLASPSIDPSLISKEWVENHFKWIVLKMAAMERMFPREFGNRYLTPNNLMLQLKYRYDREIDRSQRPALRKILEKDETPAKTMVLFVADICDVDTPVDTERPPHVRRELVLSDGWYDVRATVDLEMEGMLRSRRVRVGTKLMITGAELLNNEAGCHPLETPANVRLRVSTNSTRRARWFARLGFHARAPSPARLSAVLGRGGAVPALTATVARTYPMMFLEKVNGKTVVRGERAEQTAADEHQARRQQLAETILAQLQRDLETAKSSKRQPSVQTSIKHVTNTKELYSLLDGVDDISFLQDVLSIEQLSEIKQLKEEEMRTAQQQLQERLVEQLNKKLAPRNVSRMFKVRLVDEERAGTSALLTVWNPSDDVLSCLSEGSLLTFFHISASGYSRFGDLQLTAGKQTKYSLQKHGPSPRRITTLSELQNSDLKPEFSEVDVVGLVILSSDSTPDNNSRLIYLADASHNFLGVSFWTDLKATGYANTLAPGALVAATNLHWRSHVVSWRLPSAYVTEMSTVSQHPRQPHLQEAMSHLRRQLQSVNLQSYLESCKDRIETLVAQRNSGGAQKESLTVGGSNRTADPTGQSVIRLHSVNGSANISSDKVKFSASVSESPSVETPTNSHRRLEMLGRYGEPPPISPLPTSTPTCVKRSFRPPTRKLTDES